MCIITKGRLICLSSFVLGWFFGSLVVMMFLSLSNDSSHLRLRQITNYRSDIALNSIINDLKPLLGLKSSKFHDNDTIGYSNELVVKHISLDWPYNHKTIGFLNYKCLESLLEIYPLASYRFYTSNYCNDKEEEFCDKNNVAFKDHFIKYRKLGYNIASSFIGRGKLSQIGSQYWNKNKDSLYKQSPLPYHLLTYIRLAKLWKTGGIYQDLTFLFNNAIHQMTINQGFTIISGNHSDLFLISSMFVFNEPKSDVLLCALKYYEDDEFLDCVENGVDYICVSKMLTKCFEMNGVVNDLKNIEDIYVDSNAYTTSQLLLFNRSNEVTKEGIVWLGLLAVDEAYHISSDSVIHRLISNIRLSHRNQSRGIDLICSKNDSDIVSSIVLVSFPHSSNKIDRELSNHPSVLPSLCGGPRPRYLLNSRELRDQCIPFIEKNEKYLVLDHSQLYASDQMVPFRITEDNINTRVVFTLRHPVDRFIEHYLSLNSRKINGSDLSLRSILNDMYNKDSKYSQLRQMVTNGSSDEVIRQYYAINNNNNYSYTDILFASSVYYPIVQHFTKQLTSRNVLIVDGFNDTLNRIFNYLGFCIVPNALNKITSSFQLQNVISDSDINNREVSQDIYSQLNLFFEPFIISLMSLTDVNLTHWIKSDPPDYLPLFSTADNNKSSPAQWFENSLSPVNIDSGIMSHLLPKGKSGTDERFNTTLGMLISF